MEYWNRLANCLIVMLIVGNLRCTHWACLLFLIVSGGLREPREWVGCSTKNVSVAEFVPNVSAFIPDLDQNMTAIHGSELEHRSFTEFICLDRSRSHGKPTATVCIAT